MTKRPSSSPTIGGTNIPRRTKERRALSPGSLFHFDSERDFADRLLAAYPGGDTPAAKKTGRDLTRDTTFGWHTWTWARLQQKTGKSKVFLYYFDEHPAYAADSPRAGFGSAHASELPYVFRQLREHNRQIGRAHV